MEARPLRYPYVRLHLLYVISLARYPVPDQRLVSADSPLRPRVYVFLQHSPLILLPSVLRSARPAGTRFILLLLALHPIPVCLQPAPATSGPVSKPFAGDTARLPQPLPYRPASRPTKQHQPLHRPSCAAASSAAPPSHTGLQRPGSGPET